MPDGRTFSGPGEFRQHLVSDTDAFARAFIEKVATYALRRPMTFDDDAQLSGIASAGKEDGYQLRDLLESFVTSDLFRKR